MLHHVLFKGKRLLLEVYGAVLPNIKGRTVAGKLFSSSISIALPRCFVVAFAFCLLCLALASNYRRRLQCRQLLERLVWKSQQCFCVLSHIHRCSSSINIHLCICVFVFGVENLERVFLFCWGKHKQHVGHQLQTNIS
jgi:hypothetical protein